MAGGGAGAEDFLDDEDDCHQSNLGPEAGYKYKSLLLARLSEAVCKQLLQVRKPTGRRKSTAWRPGAATTPTRVEQMPCHWHCLLRSAMIPLMHLDLP